MSLIIFNLFFSNKIFWPKKTSYLSLKNFCFHKNIIKLQTRLLHIYSRTIFDDHNKKQIMEKNKIPFINVTGPPQGKIFSIYILKIINHAGSNNKNCVIF